MALSTGNGKRGCWGLECAIQVPVSANVGMETRSGRGRGKVRVLGGS